MLKYQYIEFALKSCLIRYHAAVKFRLAGYLPHELPLDAIEAAPLGRLTKWFKSYSNDEPLIRSLTKIEAERNYAAHQGFVFTCEEQADDAHVLERLKELDAAHERAEECLGLLFSEIKRAEEIVQRAYADLRTRSEAEGKSPPEAFKLPSLAQPLNNGP